MTFDKELHAEVERSRQSAARLLESLSLKLRIEPTVRYAAQFVKTHSIKEAPGGIRRLAQLRPISAIGIAIIAGYLLGNAFRRD